MSVDARHIPAGSQTVGPFFTIGMDYLIERMAEVPARAEAVIEIRGRVLDRDGAPVPDAILEFWCSGNANVSNGSQEQGFPQGFRRVATDLTGSFAARVGRPVARPLEDGRVQAPHILVLVFARGLLRHLITRVYLEDENGNACDPVLMGMPAERRRTLIAKRDDTNAYRWDVILQGADETVFFAW